MEAVFKLSVRCGHLGQFSFEAGVVLLPEGKVLSCRCQAPLGRRARTHEWAVTGGVVGPCQAALNNTRRRLCELRGAGAVLPLPVPGWL